jgi:putative ATPase
MLRSTGHRLAARKLGHGTGYIYPHEDERGFALDYLPEELRGRTYYRPSGQGEEVDEGTPSSA